MNRTAKEICIESVKELENYRTQPITLSDATAQCYDLFVQKTSNNEERTRCARFAGKRAVLLEIERLLKESNTLDIIE